MTKRANAEKTPTGGSNLLKKITAIGSIAAVAFGLGGCSSTEASPAPAPTASHALETAQPTTDFRENTPELSGIEDIENRGFELVEQYSPHDAETDVGYYIGWIKKTACPVFFERVEEGFEGDAAKGTVYLIIYSQEKDAEMIGWIEDPRADTLIRDIEDKYPNSEASRRYADCSGS